MKKRHRLLIVVALALFISGCFRIVAGEAGEGDKIRVLVLRGASSLTVKGSQYGPLAHVKREGYGTVKVNGRQSMMPLRLKPDRDFVYINGKPYRGAVEIDDAKDGLMVVDELYVERYLVGIINNEISSRWPEDAVKTQAVIARTYALYQKRKRSKDLYHIEGSVMGQVYSGAETEDAVSSRAVRSTAGQILAYNGEPALTVYHSNAGGMTDSSRDVWMHDYPYLRSVKSPYDETAPGYLWEFRISPGSLKELLNKAGYGTAEPESIEREEVTGSGRVKAVVIRCGTASLRLSGEDLRKAVGYGALKSAIFEVRKDGGSFVFSGRGSGHGVGLSQWGAKGMADKGYSYKEILRHYYPGTDLVRAY